MDVLMLALFGMSFGGMVLLTVWCDGVTMRKGR